MQNKQNCMCIHDKCQGIRRGLPDLELPPTSSFPFSFLIYTAFVIKSTCAKSETYLNHCFINFNIMFYVFTFEIGILVLNTCIGT